MTNPVVGVSPPSALSERPRLFQALSQALDVQFVAAQSGPASIAATVHFGEEPERFDRPSLVLGAGQGAAVARRDVAFSRSETLDRHLRGWVITDNAIEGAPCLGENPGATVLAEVAGLPVWSTATANGHRVDFAALAPEELGAEESLRSMLTSNRFLALLPLVAFVRSLFDPWERPPVRASFIMDDPNLHAARYGFIDFAKVASDAHKHGFHLSVATIPIDGWFTSPKAARLFKDHPSALSLLIHGNNHTKHELGDNPSPIPRLQVLAQGLSRTRRFEARSGIPVAKVMAAPHGRCSAESALAMAQLGYEALCISRTFPWLERPPADAPLAGWLPADTSSVIPTIPRMPFTTPPGEIALRAFLGHPLILYGHDYDLGSDPDVFRTWTEHVSLLGDVSWTSVGEISRSLISWRRHGETLWVRPHTRVTRVTVPEGISRVVIEAGGIGYETAVVGSQHGATTSMPLSDGPAELPLVGGAQDLTIRIEPKSTVDVSTISAPRWSPWPQTRRLLTEARDRTRPRAARLRAR